MTNQTLRSTIVDRILPRVQTPGQYIGGEWNAVRKDPGVAGGKLCLAFPDTYSIGMSCCGLQVLYAVMNRRPDWSLPTCLRAAGRHGSAAARAQPAALRPGRLHPPGRIRRAGLHPPVRPLLHQRAGYARFGGHTAGGRRARPPPSAGDCRRPLHGQPRADGPLHRPVHPRRRRRGAAGSLRPVVEPEACGDRPTCGAGGNGRPAPLCLRAAMSMRRNTTPAAGWSRCGRCDAACRSGSSRRWSPTWMRSRCPLRRWCRTSSACRTASRWRSCAAAPGGAASARARRPSGRCALRQVETIVRAAVEAYRNTGYNEVSLLGLSTGDYPHIEELLGRLQETFRPLGVSVSLPSLRINQQLRLLGDLLNTDRRDGLTLAPEAALDPMRRRSASRSAMMTCTRAAAGRWKTVFPG